MDLSDEGKKKIEMQESYFIVFSALIKMGIKISDPTKHSHFHFDDGSYFELFQYDLHNNEGKLGEVIFSIDTKKSNLWNVGITLEDFDGNKDISDQLENLSKILDGMKPDDWLNIGNKFYSMGRNNLWRFDLE